MSGWKKKNIRILIDDFLAIFITLLFRFSKLKELEIYFDEENIEQPTFRSSVPIFSCISSFFFWYCWRCCCKSATFFFTSWSLWSRRGVNYWLEEYFFVPFVLNFISMNIFSNFMTFISNDIIIRLTKNFFR